MMGTDKPSVFSAVTRNDTEPAPHCDNMYESLDRKATPDAAKAREYVERLYAVFPDPKGRLRSELMKQGRRGSDGFNAALASLVLHQRLVSLGHVVAVDEERGGKGRRPDFDIAATVAHERFVIEAKTLFKRDTWSKADWWIGEVVDALNARLHSDSVWICFSAVGDWTAPCPIDDVVAAVAEKLQELGDGDHDGDANVPLARLELCFDGSRCDIAFYCRPALSDSRIVQAQVTSGGLSNTHIRIQRAIIDKHPSAYGIDGVAYAVAFFGGDAWPDLGDALRALYGQWDETDLAERGPSDGLFGPECVDQCSAISGILFVPRFFPLLDEGESLEWHWLPNPHAVLPLDPALLGGVHEVGVGPPPIAPPKASEAGN